MLLIEVILVFILLIAVFNFVCNISNFFTKMRDSTMEMLSDGTRIWYKDGKKHREDGPAVEWADGKKEWYLNDVLHREDGPAIINVNKTKRWYLNGLKHREDGPAEEYSDGTKNWYVYGTLHREDGPAEEWSNGNEVWWLHGKELIHPDTFSTMEEWFNHLNKNEEETYQLIHYYNGFIGFINNPSDKQTRVHKLAHGL